MPCWDHPPLGNLSVNDPREDPEERKIDILTRLLCYACKRIEGCETGEGYEKDPALARQLQVWWSDHKRKDQEREERERDEAMIKQKRREIINRLTPEERKLLGLRRGEP